MHKFLCSPPSQPLESFGILPKSALKMKETVHLSCKKQIQMDIYS